MAYSEWVEIRIYSENMEIKIKNIKLNWGKFYEGPNQDIEITAPVLSDAVIKSGEKYTVWSCGRDGASSGTEGSFELYDGDTQVARFGWICPWSGANSCSLIPGEQENKLYKTARQWSGLTSGPLGTITLSCVKLL
ncbi:aegerolysin family protein [Spirosoma linguale]|uniref:Aegerolysin n=1 Tax=Spirosoma linguale (strain ATCC 33905 / DSM 74 / LMG 10896 / Claus 1) TaxID=504472 RepID=D2QTE8_SPILD|nr:Aegerolysin [Spirosoma linguale DSM 74]